jgi:YbbR domain-containing protein
MKSLNIKKSLTWLISFFLAVLVWFVIVNNKEYTVNMEIPIKVYEPRENTTLKMKIPSKAVVRFKGKGRALMAAKIFKEPSLIMDVANIQERYHVSLNEYYQKYPNRVDYPRGDMEFLEVVYPDTFTILIDDKISRELPVKLNYSAEPAPGYLLSEKPVMEPESVVATGPKSKLKALTAIETRHLKTENMNRETIFEVELVNPDPSFINLSQKTVKVTFQVESIGERTFTNIPVQVQNAPENITVRFIPSTVALTIVGSNEYIHSLSSDSIQVIFDYAKKWIPSKIYYQPEVKIPEKVLYWKNLQPARIEVAIVRK